MRFVTFKKNNNIRVGLEILNKGIIDVNKANNNLPNDLNNIIKKYSEFENQIQNINNTQNIHYSIDEVKLLSPIPVPVRDIICVGKNYAKHAKEVQKSSFSTLQEKKYVPNELIIFNKATTSVIGPNDKIELINDRTNTTDYEGELGVVVGKRSKNIKYSNATDIIFGYTIINDVTARKLQNNHKQWFIGKSPDTYCPMGPCIITKDEIENIKNIKIQTTVNGETRQSGIVKDMIFNISTIIEILTKSMTLVEGDIIATGTPSGVGIGFDPPKFLKSGDKIKISVDSIGILENEVI
ncbi:MAG: hydrolase [Candidatus Pelagibacter sp.]|nr:hydrolase [Candidatus Pelagibacter sp.]OUV86725.1 MAG: hydrolase [Pelagibacteraceae bacterium TMED136]|tara:strand:- start:1435 stop:2322 length:888 start_codon:yes stop_codon:yes gene_type:complete